MIRDNHTSFVLFTEIGKKGRRRGGGGGCVINHGSDFKNAYFA